MDLNLSLDSIVSKRGRPLIPDQWSGVFKIDSAAAQVELKVRPLGPDLLFDDAMPLAPRRLRSGPEWKLLFNPDDYWKRHKNLTLENCKLTNAQLLQYGK